MRIKICGITSEPDAIAAALLGADAIGLNFYSDSPRFVRPGIAQAIVKRLPPFVEPIALFVNESSETVLRVASLLKIRTIQVHGEPLKASDLAGCGLIVAFPISNEIDVDLVKKYLDQCERENSLPVAVLLDARLPGRHGGTGKPLPWTLLADFRPQVPVILAGGLEPDNVAEAIRVVRPYAVDVASGVEKRPGVKDSSKMECFIKNAREAAAKYLA